METSNLWQDMHPSGPSMPLVKPEPLYTQSGEYPITTMQQNQVLMPNNIQAETDLSHYLYPNGMGGQSSLVGSAVASSMATLSGNYESLPTEGIMNYGQDFSDMYYGNHCQNMGLPEVPEITNETMTLTETTPNTIAGFPEMSRSILPDCGRMNNHTEGDWRMMSGVECCSSSQPTDDHFGWSLRQLQNRLDQQRIPPPSLQFAQKKQRLYGRKPYNPSESTGEFCNNNVDSNVRNAYNQQFCYNGIDQRIVTPATELFQPTPHHSRNNIDPVTYQQSPRHLKTRICREKTRQEREEEEKLSKDEKKAKDLNLPLRIDEIVNLPIDEFNERVTKSEMTESQITLARDIRRRGKNKVAAQNCRKRKIEQISELESQFEQLKDERSKEFETKNNCLRMLEYLRGVCDKLRNHIRENERNKRNGN